MNKYFGSFVDIYSYGSGDCGIQALVAENFAIAIHSKAIRSQVYTRHPFWVKCTVDDIHELPEQGLQVIYEPASHWKKDDGFSTTSRRLVIRGTGGAGDLATNDRVVLYSTTGLWVHVQKPVAERIVDTVVADIQAVHEAQGCGGKTETNSTKYRYEEICTWLSDSDAAIVLSRIPHLIKYAEDGDWGLDPKSEEKWLLVRNLRFPTLYPVKPEPYKFPVYFDVKLYITKSKQPKKLEIQTRLAEDKWVSESTWANVMRATTIKVLIAFLRWSGVSSSFIYTDQAERVTPTENIEPDGEIVSELRNLEFRFDRPPPAQMPRTIYLDLEKGRNESFNEDERKTINLLFEHERRWYKFHDEFLSLLQARPKKITKDYVIKVTSQVEGLKLTRDQLESLAVDRGVKRSHIRPTVTRLINIGILSERRCGRKWYVRMENVAFMYYTLITDPGWS